MVHLNHEKEEAETPQQPTKSDRGASASAPRIPVPTRIVQGRGFLGKIEEWPRGTAIVIESRYFALGYCFLTPPILDELATVLKGLQKALAEE